MASLTGAKVAEIKVRHHARQFGVSKYGLSRIYKVLLDLLTIKMIISFSRRPLLWFSMLAIPSAVISILALIYSVYSMIVSNGESPNLIIWPTLTVMFGALSLFLVLIGALCELIYKTGNIDLDHCVKNHKNR